MSWDDVYVKNGMTMWEPQQTIVQFTARYLRKRTGYDTYAEKRPCRRVADIGCGNGSAVHFFAKQGLEAYGTDISASAIALAREYLAKEGLKASFDVGSCDSLPYQDGFFDAITCYGVLDHVPADVANRATKEFLRVLKPGGLLFISLCSTGSSMFGKGPLKAHHTYELEDGMESGEIQHYFDQEDFRALLQGFTLIDVRHGTETVYAPDGSYKSNDGRWFITAERPHE